MTQHKPSLLSRRLFLLLLFCVPATAEQPSPTAVIAYDAYVASLEARLARQHAQPNGFLAGAQDQASLRRGHFAVERLKPPVDNPSGAAIYHWRATAFVPGARAADFERLMRDFPAYPRFFAPQVLSARIVGRQDDRYWVNMRVRQHHVITVVMDTAYDIRFGRLDPRHIYSYSRSTRIQEINSPDTPREHALSPTDEHGFLWRLDTYWSCEERDEGLYMQIESVSLTRSVPVGLGWVVGPFIESVPRESLEFTLRSTCDALRRHAQ